MWACCGGPTTGLTTSTGITRSSDWGQRSLRHTKDSVTFVQKIANGPLGYAYDYEKTLRLVPGTDQLVIEHVLKNTGTRAISSNVYDHNFLRLTPGNDGIKVTFPFKLAAANPPAADLLRTSTATALTYLRPMAYKERVSFVVTGFGASARDYDIAIADPKTGAGVRMQGDQPITRMNIFSIDTTQSAEPYIAIELAPGAQKRWRYTCVHGALKFALENQRGGQAQSRPGRKIERDDDQDRGRCHRGRGGG